MRKFIAFFMAISLGALSPLQGLAMTEVEFKSDEIVTFIVETEGDAIFAKDAALVMGAEYLDSTEGKKDEQLLLKTQARVMSQISQKSENVQKGYTYTALFNGFSIEAPKSIMEDIKALPDVKNVYISGTKNLYLETSVGQSGAIYAPSLPDSMPDNYTGAGQVIAVIDSEFDTNHEFFANAPQNPALSKTDIEEVLAQKILNIPESAGIGNVYKSEKVPFAYDYVNKNGDTYSLRNVHGTHVAGIAAGKNENLSGVAPDAQLILMKVANANGTLSDETCIAAIEDAVKLGACVINMSFGADFVSTSADSIYDEVTQNAKNAGIMLSAAAGNSGIGYNEENISAEMPDYSSGGTPAAYSAATSVASADNITDTSAPNESNISDFSSYGTDVSLELKPEITAPGGKIYSSVPDDKYATYSGTSMAAPHLSGIAALMNEYLDENIMQLSGKERVEYIENALMSTATVLENPKNNVPYSPRLQGAGLVNTAAAMKTPVIITTETGKTKISLGDGLENSFVLDFALKNSTNNDVTYDETSLQVLTDLAENGVVTAGDSKMLKIYDTILPESVTVPANGTLNLSITVTLDENELLENAEVFTNGFYIDGFVSFASTNAEIPQIGIPFTGFYASWDSGDIFDKTMYQEGGSVLYQKGSERWDGTYLYTDTNKGTSYTVCGKFFDEDKIAISPNGDGEGDILGINLIPLREITDAKIYVLNANGGFESNINFVLSKYHAINGSFDIKDFPDGEHILVVTGRLNYTNSQTRELVVPFTIDRVVPEILSAKINGNILTVTASDNHFVKAISLGYVNENGDISYIEKACDSKNAEAAFDISGLETEKIILKVTDYALNSDAQALEVCMGEVQARFIEYITDENGTLARFALKNNSESDISAKVIAARYDENGNLISAYSEDKVIDIGDKADLYVPQNGGHKIRIFIWSDLATTIPLDAAKTFIMN